VMLSYTVVIPAIEMSPESLLVVSLADSEQARMTIIFGNAGIDLIIYLTRLAYATSLSSSYSTFICEKLSRNCDSLS